MAGGRHVAGYRSRVSLHTELGAATAERRQTIAPIEVVEEFYQKYNQIIGKLVNMIIKPDPWLLKRGV
jgi:hypothetical protein